MEYDQIKKLMDDMGESKLTAIDIEFPDGIKISMKKENNKVVTTENVASAPIQTVINKVENCAETEEKEEKEGKKIKSPMVGTFYSKPSPTAKPYVEVGTKVKKGDILCIIEAMKLMNEIEAEQDGEIVKILVKDGDMVDYGKELFVIK